MTPIARNHPRAILLTLALVAGVIALFTFASTASANGSLNYVALGDSYAAGPLIPDQIAVDTVPGCAQSNHNYPHDLAALASFVSLTDVSCSGATTVNMENPQTTGFGTAPPQLNAVTRSADVVTLTIGGNDIGFSSIIGSCISPTPTGDHCQHLYDLPSGDVLRQRIAATAPKIDAVLAGIKARSPHARVVVVGYPDILPSSGPGCYSAALPFTPSDTIYLDGVERDLNSMLRTEAHKNHAGFGDSYALSVGHDACTAADVRWVEPLAPANPAAPAHPNAKGEKAMAGAALIGLFF
jgi:lysophospholipase L1-like esterase